MKLKLSKKEIKAVKDSIKHWEKDIQAPLLKGDKIDEKGIRWISTGQRVKFSEEDCPLCRFANEKSPFDFDACLVCPYFKKYGNSCDEKHWLKFVHNPNLRNCNTMIRALEMILE